MTGDIVAIPKRRILAFLRGPEIRTTKSTTDSNVKS
jgi:hypothetical protein